MLGMFLIGRVFYEGRGFVVDPDVWWHIKVGQDILRTHHFPTVDPYSFTAVGTPWIAYEWLGEILLALMYRAGGVVSLCVFLIALGSIILISLYWLATVRSGNSKAAFVSTLFLASLAFASFTLRPQMFGYLFLILTLLVMEKFRQGVSWPLWTLPLIFLAWVNTHGSFIIGIGVVAFVFVRGTVFVSTGQCASHRVDPQTAAATGGGAAVLSCGLADHSVWHATGRVSVRYGVFAAHQRCQRK